MKKKILICDDEIDIHFLIKCGLEKSGYEFCDAWDGRQSLEMIKKEKPDLVILDYNMPYLSGDYIITELRKENLKTGIIVLSGINLDQGMREFLEKNASGYLVKPFSCDELVGMIDKIFSNEN